MLVIINSAINPFYVWTFHSYHDECIKTLEDGTRTCQVCFDEFECLFQKIDDEENALDIQKEMNATSNKFHVIAKYFGKGLFENVADKEEGANSDSEENEIQEQF